MLKQVHRDSFPRLADPATSAPPPSPAEVLRRGLDRTAEDLERALAALDDQSWRAEVRSAPGRTIRPDRDVRVITPHGRFPAGAPMAVIGYQRPILGLTES